MLDHTFQLALTLFCDLSTPIARRIFEMLGGKELTMGEGLLFLQTDGVRRYCPCGGQLVVGVEPAAERRYRLVVLAYLRGTLLHRQLERREAGEAVEVTVGGRLDQHINICCGS